MSDEKVDPLRDCMDAVVWAREFCRIANSLGVTQKEDPDKTSDTPTLLPIDESWMFAWFANAIMAGYDHGARHAERRLLGTLDEPRSLKQLEQRAISHTLTLYDGNMSKAARVLGIDRRTLYRKTH
jgi:DNA-binding NtrC family response regulator